MVPFQAKPTEAPVIPHDYALTFTKALHVQLYYPNKAQMLQKFRQLYFMLEDKQMIDKVCDSFDPPASVREEVIDDPTPTSVWEEDAEASMKKLKSYHKDDPYLILIVPTIKVNQPKNVKKKSS